MAGGGGKYAYLSRFGFNDHLQYANKYFYFYI